MNKKVWGSMVATDALHADYSFGVYFFLKTTWVLHFSR